MCTPEPAQKSLCESQSARLVFCVECVGSSDNVNQFYPPLKITSACYSKPLPREVALMLMLRRPPVSPCVIQTLLVLEFPHPCMVLHKFISTSSGLTERIACGLMRQLVLAVQHCIDHGVFHNNILVNTGTSGLKLIEANL
ncbi:Serine/threonine-protein kinase pim-3 [Labeo rohita]|uniref:non-specific serine/threonine protein kinase n=1 Tax=Labeo rohita TaxID=84645 RepID=A0ABQ8LLS0_LABRO|nr:Serine/threonine-protein kinase pim-3 [Labeo rohita]